MEAGGEQGGARGPYLTKIWERPGPRARHAAPHRSPVGRRGETSTISSWRAAVPRGTRPEDARSCGGASRVAGRAPRLLSTPPRPVTPPRTDLRSDGAGRLPPSAPGVLLCLEGLVAATARRRAALGPLYAGGRPSHRRPTASRTPQLPPPAPIPLAREPPRRRRARGCAERGGSRPRFPFSFFSIHPQSRASQRAARTASRPTSRRRRSRTGRPAFARGPAPLGRRRAQERGQKMQAGERRRSPGGAGASPTTAPRSSKNDLRPAG